jgi:hypothetical protein
MAPTTFHFRIAPGLATFCVAAVLFCSPVTAQWGGGWGGGWGMGNWASTAQQGAADGIAAVVRSAGYANLKNSEAAKNWQEAKSMEIDNRMKWTETYFEMRKTNREARAAEDGPPVTQEQAIRLAKMAAPPRLGSTQLDPVTGHVEYPLVLRDDIFAPNRQEIDTLFARRAASGGSVQYGEIREMQDAVSKFIDVLRQNVGNYAAGDYGRARTFLDSLAREARMPAG